MKSVLQPTDFSSSAGRVTSVAAARGPAQGRRWVPRSRPDVGPWGARARGGVGHALPGKAQLGIVAQHAALDGQDDAVQLGGHPVGLLAEGSLQDGGSV